MHFFKTTLGFGHYLWYSQHQKDKGSCPTQAQGVPALLPRHPKDKLLSIDIQS